VFSPTVLKKITLFVFDVGLCTLSPVSTFAPAICSKPALECFCIKWKVLNRQANHVCQAARLLLIKTRQLIFYLLDFHFMLYLYQCSFNKFLSKGLRPSAQ
jgi:hypothetical protein